VATWDLPTKKTGGRGLMVAVIGAATLLLAAVGTLVALTFKEPSGEGGSGGPAVASTVPGHGSSKVTPVAIDPTDLLPVSQTPHSQPVRDAEPPPPDAGADGGREAGPPAPPKQTKTVINRPAGKGTLFLNTRPWSKVALGGRDLGTTPLINVELPAGSHALRLVDADGVTHNRRVKINPDQATKVFFDLSQENAPQ
jgi:hypothetical protein